MNLLKVIGSRAKSFSNLILAAKANAFNGKFSPDIEDVKAVAIGILRHRILRTIKQMLKV
jgi:MoxR-like ATPase